MRVPLPTRGHHVLRPLRPAGQPPRATAPTSSPRCSPTGNDREGVAQRMRDAEHHADETTHEIVRRVNSTFVTPFDREDIYRSPPARRRDGPHGGGRRPASCCTSVDDAAARDADQVEVLQRAAELTAEAMPRLRDDEGPRGVLDRDQPAGERRRQELPAAPRPAVLRRVRSARGAQDEGGRRRARGRRSTRSSTSRTPSSRSPSRSPERGARDRRRGRRRRPGLRLHQRLPRRRQRDRHLGLDPGADPRVALVHGGDRQLRRRASSARRSPRPSATCIDATGRAATAWCRVRRPARRDRLEPDHLVLRPARRRPRTPSSAAWSARRRRVRRRCVQWDEIIEKVAHPDGGLAAGRLRGSRSC